MVTIRKSENPAEVFTKKISVSTGEIYENIQKLPSKSSAYASAPLQYIATSLSTTKSIVEMPTPPN